jgi:predicted amidophosphoribosyltransferase
MKPIGDKCWQLVPCAPDLLDAITFFGGAVAGEYLTATDPRDRSTHPMTCLVRRFKVGRDRDGDVADLLVAAHSRAGMSPPDVVVSAPVSQPVDRFACVRASVTAALGARTADVLIERWEIPGYREMSAAERRAAAASLRGCRFAVSAPWTLRDQVVLLIDDVVASGETARCIAEALHQAGAREVQFVALAHAVSLNAS